MTPREGAAPSAIDARAVRRLKGGTATISPHPGGKAEVVRDEDPGDSFGTIEGSDDYVARLLQAVEETATDVAENLRCTRGAGGRQREALQLAAYKLEQLRFHLTTSRRRLNDLRNLRRIVEGEPSMDRERPEELERCA